MYSFQIILSALLSITSVNIVQPVDGETYEGDWLEIRAIVQNGNTIPDSVHYCLNGQPVALIPRLNTDWYTYMANDCHTGWSPSPAPHDNTILWTAPIAGETHEFPNPVIVDGIVYYPQNSGGDSLFALDAATGSVIWKYWVGSADDAVTVKNGYLYVASDSLWCLDASNGDRIWATAEANGGGSTPVVSDGLVFAGTEDIGSNNATVACFDANTGSQIWQDTLPGHAVSCMGLWSDILLFPTYSDDSYGIMYGLEANTGAVVWENSDAFQGFWDSSPVIIDSLVYICGQDGNLYCIDPLTGSTIWTSFTHQYITATPAFHDNRLFFAPEATDQYYSLEASYGEVLWSVPGSQHGSSAVADGLVFYGDLLSSNPDSAMIRALDVDSGGEVWHHKTDGVWIAGTPAVTDGVMYMSAHDGNLYAFSTGLKYTYLDDLFADVGSNELIVTSFMGGAAVATDTITFTVTQTGITLEPSTRLGLQASPNPFLSSTVVSFHLEEPGMTQVSVYDLSGRMVRMLENTELEAGEHLLHWDGTAESGEPVSAGIYICRTRSGRVTETTGLCLLR